MYGDHEGTERIFAGMDASLLAATPSQDRFDLQGRGTGKEPPGPGDNAGKRSNPLALSDLLGARRLLPAAGLRLPEQHVPDPRGHRSGHRADREDRRSTRRSSFSAEARRDAYPLMLKPDGRVHLAGDHLTNWNAWMQGALDSGRLVATDIHKLAGQESRPHANTNPWRAL